MIRCASLRSSTTASSRRLGASEDIFKFMDAQDDVQEKKRAHTF